MKRIFSLALMVVLVINMLAACGGQGGEDGSRLDASVGQSQTNDPVTDDPGADDTADESPESDLPRVWLLAQVGTYEDGAWEGSVRRYERNAYGLYTAVKDFDGDGNELKNNVKIKQTYDDAGRLTHLDNGETWYFFTYDQAGGLSQIHIQDDRGRDLVELTYSEDGGYRAVTYDDNYSDTYEICVYDEDFNEISRESVDLGKVVLVKESTYDSAGLLVMQTYTKGGLDHIVEYTYNSDGVLTKKVTTATPSQQGTDDYDGFMGSDDYSEEYVLEYTYDDNGRLTKQVETRTISSNGTASVNEFIDGYTYSAAGNLLTHTGTQYGPTCREGRLYAFEEYTDEDYNERGECLYYYSAVKNSWTGAYTFEKKAAAVNTCVYADEGWLLREEWGEGSFIEYDRDGNVVMENFSSDCSAYQAYPIIDDALLLAFYELYGDEYV